MKNLQEFLAFILERHRIYERRKRGEPPPWTIDPILQKFRFTNIYRHLDRTTIWIWENLREPLSDSPYLVAGMTAARMINRIETLGVLKPEITKLGWSDKCEGLMRELAESGEPITNAAYMITTPAGLDKAAGINHICEFVWRLSLERSETLKELADKLMTAPRIGTFIAAQIVADVKPTKRFRNAPDWLTFALSGPGSRRGLNYVYGRDFDAPWDEEEWHANLLALREETNKLLHSNALPGADAHNVQNMCCEFQKYMRCKLSITEPKQLFKPYQAETQKLKQESFI